MIKKKETLTAIKQEVEIGESSTQVIANRLRLAPGTIYVYGLKLGYHLNHTQTNQRRQRRVPVPIRLTLLREALAKDEKSLEELCKLTGLKPHGVRKLCESIQVELPEDLVPYKTRPKLDEKIEQGLTLEEIGEGVGLTKGGVRKYILTSGQYTLWEKAKEDRKTRTHQEQTTRKTYLGQFDTLLRKQLHGLAKTEGWAYEKAVDYFNSIQMKESNIPLYILVDLLDRYRVAQELGIRRSLEGLTEGLPMTSMGLSNVLRRLELEPLHGKKSKHKKLKYGERQKKRDAVIRSSGTDLGSNDLAYFLNCSPTFILFYGCNTQVRDTREVFLGRMGSRQITYRLASQVYEAVDVGFTSKEIAELYEKSPRIIQYILDHRVTFEPKIIEKLRELYDNPKLDKPHKISLE